MLETILRHLKLPVSQRKKLEQSSWETLTKVETLLEKMKGELHLKISYLKNELLSHLKTTQVRESFYTWDISSLPIEQKAAVYAEDVELFLDVKLGQIVEDYQDKGGLQQWAKTTLDQNVIETEKMLVRANLDLGGYHSRATNNSSASSSGVNGILDVLKSVGVTISLGAALGIYTNFAMARKMESELEMSTAAFVPGAVIPERLISLSIVIASVVIWIKETFIHYKVKNFKQNVQTAFDDFIVNEDKLCEIVKNLLKFLCMPVQAVLDAIPQKLEELEMKLNASDQAEQENVPKYQDLLRTCQNLNGKLLIMTLQCMHHKFTSDEIYWPQPKQPIGSGRFSDVYKVIIREGAETALKVMKDDITQQTVSDIKKEIDCCRYHLIMILKVSFGTFFKFVLCQEMQP